MSFFSIKHWPNPSAGIEEMVRVTHRGGYVHLVEVNAHATRDQWRRYVDLTRVPRPLRAFYVVATHPTVVRHSLTPEALGKAFPDDAPVTDVRVDAATDLPYLVARARVTHVSEGVTSR